ncbi:pyrroline-5-carboxylate reductase [Bacteroidia bacterium]|nr:pyrroline-5-carboxylate reductase [Bacteroidia bacterium]
MKIAIIGAGNMGGAIARGLTQSSIVKSVSVSDLNQKALDSLKAFNANIAVSSSNAEIVKNANIVLLAVKPWLVESVAIDIKDHINYEEQLIVSIAAGVPIAKLTEYFSPNAQLFRIIPNTAIEVRQSLSTVASYNNSPENEQLVLNIFNELGKAILVQEKDLNAYMSLSSCGIAYAFRYIRAAMEGAVELGIYPGVAQEVVLQTLRGAVNLLEANAGHPETEIDKVTTPGGITIKGLNEMEACGFTNAVIKGLKASYIK